MITLHRFELLTGADIRASVAEAERESEVLDFKLLADVDGARGRREWAKDVCAMANNRGGVICIGIRENDGAATEAVGVAGVDETCTRLQQIADTGIVPRIRLSHRVVEVGAGVQVVLFAVPPAFDGPRMCLTDDDYRYYRRSGTTTVRMNVDELRFAILRGETRHAKVHFAHETHVARATAAVPNRPLYVLDVVREGDGVAWDLADDGLVHRLTQTVGQRPWHFNTYRRTFNSMQWTHTQAPFEYQLFRNGAFSLHAPIRSRGDDPVLPDIAMIEFIKGTLSNIQALFQQIGIEQSASCAFSLAGTRNHSLSGGFERDPILENTLGFEIQEWSDLVQHDRSTAKTWMDRVAQAANWPTYPQQRFDQTWPA